MAQVRPFATRLVGLGGTIALLSFAPSAAKADEPGWRFVYDAPVEGCPARSQVRNQVIARLGFDPFRDEADSELRIAIRTAEGGLVAVVERREEGSVIGERTLHATADCSELAASAALAGSILVDPTGAMAKRLAPRSEPAPAPGPTPADNPWPAGEKPPAPAPAPSIEGSLGARVVGSVGVAPAPSIGFSIDAALRRGAFELRLEGRGDLPASAEPRPDGAGVATTLLVGSVLPCWAHRWFHFCGVLSAGGMFARSENLTPAERDGTFFAAAGLRPMVELRLSGRLSMVASAEGLLPLRKLTVTVRGVEVWSSPVVAGALGLGFQLKFL